MSTLDPASSNIIWYPRQELKDVAMWWKQHRLCKLSPVYSDQGINGLMEEQLFIRCRCFLDIDFYTRYLRFVINLMKRIALLHNIRQVDPGSSI